MQMDIKKLFSENKGWSFVFIDNKGKVHSSTKKGIAPMMKFLEKNQDAFEGGIIGDKVVGKAAAHLAIYGKAKAIYAKTISEPALTLLKKWEIPCTYEKEVPFIENRTRTGPCPMEEKVLDIDDPARAYKVLKGGV